MSKQIHLSKKRRPPPISTIVCAVPTQYDIDEQSQITMQTFNDTSVSNQTRSSQTNNHNDSDNNLQLQQLTADPYYFHTLSPQASKKLGLDTTQGLVTLKIQNARQQEKIEIISSQLRACKVENEQLKAENTSLLKEVMIYKQDTANYTNDEQARMLAIYKRYEPSTNSSAIVQHQHTTATTISDEDSVKLLRQENQQLKAENARLQTLNEVMKKSFKAYINDQKMKNGNLDNSEARKIQVQKRCSRVVPPSTAAAPLSQKQQQSTSTSTAIQTRKSSMTSSSCGRSSIRKSIRGKSLNRTISTSERTALTSPDSILDDSRSSYRSSIKVKVVPLDTSSRSSGTMKASNANEVKAKVHKVQHKKTVQPPAESSTGSVKTKAKTGELLVDFGSITSSKQPVQEPTRLLSFRRTLATLKEEYMTR